MVLYVKQAGHMSEETIPTTDKLPDGVAVFHYIKSNFFRVVYATGMVGGISPKGEIQIGFFNERYPIPQRVGHKMIASETSSSAKMIGETLDEYGISKQGIIREVEVEVLMNYATASAFHQWLGEQVNALKNVHEIK